MSTPSKFDPLTAELNRIRAEFLNPRVTNAMNKHPDFGYFVGPIPNNNHGWIPPTHMTAIAAGAKVNNLPSIKVEENAEAPNPGVALSRVNTFICDIDVTGDGDQFMEGCGVACNDQPSLRRHIRTAHPGALVNPTKDNTTTNELLAGQAALRRYVLHGDWRGARFVHEPTDIPKSSLVVTYADKLELLAKHDATFASQYGTNFHRIPGSSSGNLESSLALPATPLKRMHLNDEEDNDEESTDQSTGKRQRVECPRIDPTRNIPNFPPPPPPQISPSARAAGKQKEKQPMLNEDNVVLTPQEKRKRTIARKKAEAAAAEQQKAAQLLSNTTQPGSSNAGDGSDGEEDGSAA